MRIPRPFVLLALAALLAPRADASRTSVWESNPPSSYLTAMRADEAGLLAPLASAHDIEIAAAEPPHLDLGDVVLIGRELEHEDRFGLGSIDLLGPTPLRGPPPSYLETRVGGFELLAPFRNGASPSLSLWPRRACGSISCGVVSDSPEDPWGLCDKRGEPPCGFGSNEQTGGQWLLEKYEAGWDWLLEKTGGNYANREYIEIASGLNMFRGLRLFGATKYVGQRALSATGKFLDRMPVDAREFSPSAFGVGNLRLEEKAAEKTVRGVNLAQAKQVQPKPPGVEFKAPRGGGGDEAARAYAYQVTGGAEKAIYVNGTEFEGVADGILIDAKRAKGLGSWYDISGADRFTANVKIPDVIAQARRQLGAIRGTEFKGIRWVIADPTVANQIQTLFWQRGIPIDIVTAAPK